MEDIVKLFVDKFSSLTPHLTFIVMIIMIIVFATKDAISEKIKAFKISRDLIPLVAFKNISKNKKLSYEDLNNHDLFNVVEDVRSAIKFYQFKEDYNKTNIFHDFMGIMLDEIKLGLKGLIVDIKNRDEKNEDLLQDELKLLIMSCLSKIVENYCLKSEHHFIGKGLKKEDSSYVVDLFEEWRSETRASINSRVNAIFASSFHQDNFARTLAVYELISVSVSLIPKDGVRSFETMNGKFKNIEYV